MDLRHIRAFRAIMQTGSTVEAARLLGVSQPSVSRLLAEFEAATGERLFIRANGRLTPREAADLLLPDVERTLAGVEGILSQVDRTSMPLRVAAPAGVVTRILAPAVRRLQGDRPGQKIIAEIMSYHEIVAAVASGRTDLGFVKAPVDHPALDSMELVTVGTDVVLLQDHPLVKKRQIDPVDLRDETPILLGRNRPFRVQLDRLLLEAGIRPEVLIETQAVSAACSFVRQGLGVTIANALLARGESGDGLVCRPFSAALRHSFSLAYLKNPSRPRALTVFSRHIRDVAEEILQK
ncbi:MAG: LysR substrate-binding domain-containing protein [Pararhodobacter sp.]